MVKQSKKYIKYSEVYKQYFIPVPINTAEKLSFTMVDENKIHV